MKEKKLSSFEALGQLQFDDLAPDPIDIPTPLPTVKKQTLEAHYSSKGRAGKVVTLIKGFEGDKTELKDLGKALKNALKVGGTIKDNTLLIQGNHRERIIELLEDMGHRVKRVGG
ncbi:MAG: translation initiation factor [Flavobacteriia bacterium]|nr:translation initiation factor [Flavobacteriia bacterium]